MDIRNFSAAALLGTSLLVPAAHGQDEAIESAFPEPAFRVCADPNNLPFSNKAGEGFENQLAKLWASKLDKPVEYTWFPQRRGFERMTLRAQTPYGGYKCDVVMGVAAGWELGLTTEPYYRSTWAIAYLEGGKLDGIESVAELDAMPEDEKESLVAATFIGTPASHWLSVHGLDTKLRPYPALDADPARYPGMLIEQDLVSGAADFVLLWGPVAGYFAEKVSAENEGVDVELMLLPSEGPFRFDYAIAAGVRYGEGERRDALQKLIDETRDEIDALLEEYGFPVVEKGGLPIARPSGG